MENASYTMGNENQMVVPKGHLAADLINAHCHNNEAHASTSHVLAAATEGCCILKRIVA